MRNIWPNGKINSMKTSAFKYILLNLNEAAYY